MFASCHGLLDVVNGCELGQDAGRAGDICARRAGLGQDSLHAARKDGIGDDVYGARHPVDIRRSQKQTKLALSQVGRGIFVLILRRADLDSDAVQAIVRCGRGRVGRRHNAGHGGGG